MPKPPKVIVGIAVLSFLLSGTAIVLGITTESISTLLLIYTINTVIIVYTVIAYIQGLKP